MWLITAVNKQLKNSLYNSCKICYILDWIKEVDRSDNDPNDNMGECEHELYTRGKDKIDCLI